MVHSLYDLCLSAVEPRLEVTHQRFICKNISKPCPLISNLTTCRMNKKQAPSQVILHASISSQAYNLDGWFHERNSQWPGIALSLRVKKVLHEEQSQFQKVLVFESTNHGNVLVLDGAIQCVEHDEFAYVVAMVEEMC